MESEKNPKHKENKYTPPPPVNKKGTEIYYKLPNVLTVYSTIYLSLF